MATKSDSEIAVESAQADLDHVLEVAESVRDNDGLENRNKPPRFRGASCGGKDAGPEKVRTDWWAWGLNPAPTTQQK